MRVTLFDDVRARQLREQDFSIDELVQHIKATRAPTKAQLPLLKLATFGADRSEHGSLRHDANVQAVTGIETDYDDERIGFDDALAWLQEANVEAIIYTSPSHEPEAPRWRVLFPLSSPSSPSSRRALADKAFQILHGAMLATETWTLSQAYFYGVVNDDFRIAITHGAFIDALDLPAPPPTEPPPQQPTSINDLPVRLKRVLKSGDPAEFGYPSRSEMVYYVINQLVRVGWTNDRIISLLLDRSEKISAHVYDQNNPPIYARSQVEKIRDHQQRDWERTPQGKIDPTSTINAKRALETMGVRMYYDTFVLRGFINGATAIIPVDDDQVRELRFGIEDRFKFCPNREFFREIVQHVAFSNPIHPVRSYLDTLTWDGTPRIDTYMIDYANAEDTPYTRAVSRLLLIAACRRVRAPGCKFDEMVVLVDPVQGSGKSTFVRTLAVREEWFSDNFPLHVRGKEVIEHLQGKWLVECAELEGMHKRDAPEMKALLSRSKDNARMSYAYFSQDVPRQSVFVGTTNSTEFLEDLDNRRYWPIPVHDLDPDALLEVVDQLWAEASQHERAGEPIHLDKSLWPAATETQKAFRTEDAWASAISDVLCGEFSTGRVRSTDVFMILNIPPERQLTHVTRRLGLAMRELGWERKKLRVPHESHPKWCYVRGTPDQQAQQIYIQKDAYGPPIPTFTPAPNYGNDMTF